MHEFDLTSKFGPFLNRHLVFPLLEFLSNKKIYNDREIQTARLELLYNTNMVDFAIDIYAKLYGGDDIPADLKDRREKVLEEYQLRKVEILPISDIFMNEDVQAQLDASRDCKALITYLTTEHGFNLEMLDIIYTYAKFQYECGNYDGCFTYLYLYRGLVPTTDKRYMSSLWGILATDILNQSWENALEDINRLKEIIDSGASTTPLHALQQRTWLIHWSLFVFFNHNKGRDLIIEMFLYQMQYLNAIQTTCPHILRYLAAAVIVVKANRKQYMRDLVRVIQQESYTYKDPITEFLAHLYVDFDFEAAQEKLKQCAIVIGNDFFLVACLEDFIENARLMIFELFCRIHQCIRIDMLAEKLNMSPTEAEKWSVNLIRQAKLDAKIDSKLGHVVMETQALSPYQQLIDKTKSLSFRTQVLLVNAEKKVNARNSVDLVF